MKGMEPGRRISGITLVETVTVVAVVVIIGTIAVPNFMYLQRSAQRTAIINDFVHAVHFARSEAIKRNSTVSICRSSDGSTCANSAADWNSGWIVFENLDGDQPADTDPGEPILLRHDRIRTGSFTSNRVSFSFRAFSQGDVNGTLVFCPSKGSAKDARAIIISHTGRPRTSDRDAEGKALKC